MVWFYRLRNFFCFFFFFQAEDGIRDTSVTGVQTCALPISRKVQRMSGLDPRTLRVAWMTATTSRFRWGLRLDDRSEERRVGKECRSRWSPDDEKENKKRERKEVSREERE